MLVSGLDGLSEILMIIPLSNVGTKPALSRAAFPVAWLAAHFVLVPPSEP